MTDKKKSSQHVVFNCTIAKDLFNLKTIGSFFFCKRNFTFFMLFIIDEIMKHFGVKAMQYNLNI